MKIAGSVALVTGANRGLGRAYARELVSRGAAKVYGAARQPGQVTEPGVTPIALDIAPVLAANGGGAVVNMLSVTSFYANPFNASYGASKTAAWSLTNGVRLELHHQGTLVVAVHAGFIDTDMAALVDAPKVSPESVAKTAFDAVEAGQIEVLVDERTRTIKASLSRDHELIYPAVQEFWDSAIQGSR
jgi:NAD(P)-dependent dehydrogenase (short-subunit alcohol dehydrogenase family)